MDGWMDGWMGGKAGLSIAYSNQKLVFKQLRERFAKVKLPSLE
jgi:hypothetical protein